MRIRDEASKIDPAPTAISIGVSKTGDDPGDVPGDKPESDRPEWEAYLQDSHTYKHSHTVAVTATPISVTKPADLLGSWDALMVEAV
jgi:hypothetical protein